MLCWSYCIAGVDVTNHRISPLQLGVLRMVTILQQAGTRSQGIKVGIVIIQVERDGRWEPTHFLYFPAEIFVPQAHC